MGRYLSERRQHAPTVVKQMELCSVATLDNGNVRVMLHDLFSMFHMFPMSQQ